MSASSANKAMWGDVVAQLQAVGFKKRAGLAFTREVSDDVIGWLGLNRASRYLPAGEFEVYPMVGVRHQGIERVVAELRGEKFHQYVPPTVVTPLGYLMPEARSTGWTVSAADPGANAEAIATAVADFAVPFMESGANLASLRRLIGARMGHDHQLVYRHPVACLLAGDIDRAAELIDAADEELGDSRDAAAEELRSFIAAFRIRYLLSSTF